MRNHDPQTILCPRCGQSVYRRAIRCPHCDSSLLLDNETRTKFVSTHVMFESRRRNDRWIGWLLALAAVGAAAAWHFLR